MGAAMAYANSPVIAVRNYIDAFNRGDVEGMAKCFAGEGSILDGFAPQLWVGSSAASDWYRDMLAEAQHQGASDFHATIGEPLHNDITGDTAYFVAPASMTFKLKGQQVTQSGATFTFALKREDEDWRIAAWAWAKGQMR
jgi:ketosteroid isomerase-like protein